MADLTKTCGMSEWRHITAITHTQTLMRQGSAKLITPILLSVTICLFGLPAQAKYGGGTGTAEDPYLVYDANQMNTIGAYPTNWDKHFKLMADVNLASFTGTSFNIIGIHGNPFSGVFDGNNHVISNFTYSTTETNYIGIFGVVSGENAEIKDLGLVNPNVDAGTGHTVGSLVGFNSGIVSGCYAQDGTISGEMQVGGLVGSNRGTIANCYATGSVSGSGSDVVGTGGLVGENYFGAISNCYSTGSASGVNMVGGLVGNNHVAAVVNCYSTGSVVGDSNVGGLVGYNKGAVSASFWDVQTSSQSNMCGGGSGSGCDNANGKTTAQMQDMNTFLAVGWDFVGESANGPSEDWAEPNTGSYPILWWQLPEEQLPALPTFSGGTGEPNDPYLIATASDLNRIGHNPRLMEAHFKLIDNIDLAGVDFFLIGSPGYGYSGVFNGNGHTISNLTYGATGTNNIGLFGAITGKNAEVKDLGLIDPNIDAGAASSIGSLVGWLRTGTISGCYVKGKSVTGYSNIGGLVGYNSAGTITNCHSSGIVSGGFVVGGLVGRNKYGTITNCYSSGDLLGDYATVGGLVGGNVGTVTNCYALGDVSGDWEVGGLAGFNASTILNCYSKGTVSGTWRVGGLVAYEYAGGTIADCYSTGDVSGNDVVGGLLGEATDIANISNCYSSGSASGENIIGGLVGRTLSNRTISNCYARGSVSGIQYIGGLAGESLSAISDSYSSAEVTGVLDVGGLVGWNAYDVVNGQGTITNCHATGPITGIAYVGGLVGNNDGPVSASFWDTQTSALSNMCGRQRPHGSGCNDSGGRPTAQMQNANTFLAAGWDFIDTWDICEGTNYPKLVWQIPKRGDFICPDGVDMDDLDVFVEEWLLPVLSADVAPHDGDGVVNFLDWAIFAHGWQITNDIDDLAVFTNQWLGQALSADVAPAAGDKFVDFSDWAMFAAAWRSKPASPNWNPKCDIAPTGGDNIVDMDDVVIFIAEWLKAASHYRHLDADIASDGSDGIVNMLDYCVFAENWLTGVE